MPSASACSISCLLACILSTLPPIPGVAKSSAPAPGTDASDKHATAHAPATPRLAAPQDAIAAAAKAEPAVAKTGSTQPPVINRDAAEPTTPSEPAPDHSTGHGKASVTTPASPAEWVSRVEQPAQESQVATHPKQGDLLAPPIHPAKPIAPFGEDKRSAAQADGGKPVGDLHD